MLLEEVRCSGQGKSFDQKRALVCCRHCIDVTELPWLEGESRIDSSIHNVKGYVDKAGVDIDYKYCQIGIVGKRYMR
jgi:hypothetical protein